MGNLRSDTTGITEKTIVKVEKCGHALEKEKKPILGADLDANGHELQNIKDIHTNTINGNDTSVLALKLNVLFAGIAKIVDGCFAPAIPGEDFASSNHTHDLASLSGSVTLTQGGLGTDTSSWTGIFKVADGKVTLAVPGEDFATVIHTHSTADLTDALPLQKGGLGIDASLLHGLLKIEAGLLGEAEAGVDFAAVDHTHPECSAVVSLQRGGLGEDLSEKTGIVRLENGSVHFVEVTPEVTKDLFASAISALDERLKVLETFEPQPDSPEMVVRVMETEYVMVPRKCHGLHLTEVTSKSLTGTPTDVTILRNGVAMDREEPVETDDILTLSCSPSLVRLTFS